MANIEASIQAARAAGIDVWIAGGATPEQVRRLERELGISLPESYRLFLTSVGALSLHECHVAGIVEHDPLSRSAQSLFWETERARQEQALPADLLVLQANDEAPYCLHTRVGPGEEMPVVCYQVNTKSAQRIAGSFEDWIERFIFDAAA